MNMHTNNLNIARQPQQDRSRLRFSQILETAVALLREQGVSQFSIPQIAERLDCSRNSIYKLFPTPYAVLNELTQNYLQELVATLITAADSTPASCWQDRVHLNVKIGAEFYNTQPVAAMLVLGGSATDESYRAMELTTQHLGSQIRRMMRASQIELPPGPPDVASLCAEIGSGSFRLSYFLHQGITPAYQAEAARAMIAYLGCYTS